MPVYLQMLDSLKAPLYKYNQTIVKELGVKDKVLRIVTMKTLRTAGLDTGDKKITPKCSVNSVKLDCNITRARQHIFELAFCNEWDYFVTLTLDANKFNRQDLERFNKEFNIFLRDYNKKYELKIKFLLIPELHNDGLSWHFHGLFRGLPVSKLHQFKIGDTMGLKIAEKVKLGETVYKWQDYENKFGWCSLEHIKDREAVSRYIIKYINKDLAKSVKELNAHLYYHSRNLNKARIVFQGTLTSDIPYSFENEYCRISELPYTNELLDYLKNNIV